MTIQLLGTAYPSPGGLTPTVPYYPSARATTYSVAALPNNTSTFNLWYTPTLVAAWQARAASSPTDLSSGNLVTQAMAQQWVIAAYLSEQFVAGAYPLPAADCTVDQFWGNDATVPAYHHFEACQSALVYRTAYNKDGTASSGPVQSARLTALRDWLIGMLGFTWYDPRGWGFVSPATGTAYNNADTLNVAVIARMNPILGMIHVYDMIRADISSGDRLLVETKLRAMGDYFAQAFSRSTFGPYFASSLDKYGIGRPNTLAGDANEFYTQGAYPSYAWVNGSNVFGPRCTTQGASYNNRLSVSARITTLIGIVLGDSVCLTAGLRYWSQSLKFGINSDGSMNEWAERAFNYYVPQQGVIYGSATMSGLIECAACLRRSGGGNYLFTLATTAVLPSQPAGTKTLALLIDVHNNLLTRTGTQADWYAVNPAVSGAASQLKTTAQTWGVSLNSHLGCTLFRPLFGGSLDWSNAQMSDSMHDIGYIQAYDYYNSLGGTVPAGTSRTGAVLAGCLNAVCRRDAALWATATGGAPTTMPAWHSQTTTQSILSRPDGGGGTYYAIVPAYFSGYTVADTVGVVASPLFMYAP